MTRPPVPGQHNHAAETEWDVVREALLDDCGIVHMECEAALAALSSLQARHEDAEAIIDSKGFPTGVGRRFREMQARLAAAEARLAETERQRDALIAEKQRWLTEGFLGPDAVASAARAEEALREIRERADREPIDTDISDYSDEWCAGFLAGQANARGALCGC